MPEFGAFRRRAALAVVAGTATGLAACTFAAPSPSAIGATASASASRATAIDGPATISAVPAASFVASGTAPRLGKPVSSAQAALWDLNVFPDGRGLPPGRGSAVEGAALFARHCASCHGAGGRGATAEELAGGTAPLTAASPDKTIGLYWPYATTLFDFTRRAMPLQAPGSLTDDEVYAVTAYLLHLNGLLGAREPIDAIRLPRVQMPNRSGFVGIDASVP